MLPPEIKLIVPVPTPTVPKTMAPAVVKETVLEPLLESETAPVSRLFWVKVMGLAPTVKEEVPPTLRTPFCVKAPEVRVRLPPMVEAPNNKPFVSLEIVTELAAPVGVEKETTP